MNSPVLRNEASSDGTAPHPRKPGTGHSGKLLLLVLSIAITGVVIWLLARQNQGFSFQHFTHAIREIRFDFFGLALLCCSSAFALRGIRWASFVEAYSPNPNKFELIGNTLIGFAAVVVIGRPAEFLRPYLIARQLRVTFPSQVGAWLLERIYDLLSILVLSAWALLTIDATSLPEESPVTMAIRAGGGMVLVTSLVAVAVLAMFTFAAETAAKSLQGVLSFLPESRRESAARLLNAFSSALSISRNPKYLLSIIGWTVAHWFVVGVGMWAIFQSFPASAHLSLSEAFRFLAILAVASAIPLPGLVGSYYLVSALLLTEWLGLRLEDASGITLVSWTLQLGIAIPLGAVAALRSGLNWRRIKSMEQEAHL